MTSSSRVHPARGSNAADEVPGGKGSAIGGWLLVGSDDIAGLSSGISGVPMDGTEITVLDSGAGTVSAAPTRVRVAVRLGAATLGATLGALFRG